MGSWIKKDTTVEVSKELEYSSDAVVESNAYDAEITECRLANSNTAGSKSVSLVVGIKTEAGETNKTFFTIMGKDGETYFESTYKGKTIKKQHFGLSIANTLFELVLGKEIFDVEPSNIEYQTWDKEDKEMKTVSGQGFPDIVGHKIGICLQMNKEISGADSKEYGVIEHFFNAETGLFSGEEEEIGKKTKLSKWLGSMKDYKVTEKEPQNKSSFGAKKTVDATETPKKKWGK